MMTFKINISGLTALRKSLLTFAAAMGVCLFALNGSAQETAKTAGTGFVVSSDGCIATALHVTANAANLSVIFTGADGKKTAFPAVVLASDATCDLAILKIQKPDDSFSLVPLPVNGQKQNVGDEVLVVGYPFLNALGMSAKMNKGMISGFVGEFVQLDAAVNPGVSGGPVFNDSGEVIAITSAKLAGIEVSNVGLCIPASRLVQLMDANGIKNEAKSEGELKPAQLFQKSSPSVVLILAEKKPAESVDSKASPSDKASKTQTSTPVFSSMTDYKDGMIVAPNGQAIVAPDLVAKTPLSAGQTWLAPLDGFASAENSPAVKPTGIAAAVATLQYVKSVTAEKKLVASPMTACSPGGTLVESVSSDGGVIIGLEISYNRQGGVAGLTPLYLSLNNGRLSNRKMFFVKGKTIGKTTLIKTQALGKEGYVLTGLRIVPDENGSGCGGIQLQFTRACGSATIGTDAYVSDFAGKGSAQKAATFVTNGGFMVGLTGVETSSSDRQLKSVGVIVAPTGRTEK
ncbi:MAG: trypsin-like peptidase domain-containing protein [Thermoguttaceae bacterium]|nr:trypsin-like peptidase domain-containing protein [Thermoguttaceae bacterium]